MKNYNDESHSTCKVQIEFLWLNDFFKANINHFFITHESWQLLTVFYENMKTSSGGPRTHPHDDGYTVCHQSPAWRPTLQLHSQSQGLILLMTSLCGQNMCSHKQINDYFRCILLHFHGLLRVWGSIYYNCPLIVLTDDFYISSAPVELIIKTIVAFSSRQTLKDWMSRFSDQRPENNLGSRMWNSPNSCRSCWSSVTGDLLREATHECLTFSKPETQ